MMDLQKMQLSENNSSLLASSSKKIDLPPPMDKSFSFFKPFIPTDFILPPPNDEILQEIDKKLSKLTMSDKNVIVMDQFHYEIEELTKQDKDLAINTEGFSSIFGKPEEIQRNDNLKFRKTRRSYSRSSFPDLPFEERVDFTPAHYDGTTIHKWNVDGCSDHQILNIVQKMVIAATAFGSNYSDHQTARLIVAGFTGQLKGWWDNYLTLEQRMFILTRVKAEGEQSFQDAVNTLLFAITEHFIGDPTQFQERSSEILFNLRCNTLQDFKWYKDMFLCKLFVLPDCNNSYWKEKFIAGLPKLFAERIRIRLNEKFDNSIPYHELSYGELIHFIVNEGLKLCNDIKIQNIVHSSSRKRELRSFCDQYGCGKIVAPSARLRKKESHSRSSRPKEAQHRPRNF